MTGPNIAPGKKAPAFAGAFQISSDVNRQLSNVSEAVIRLWTHRLSTTLIEIVYQTGDIENIHGSTAVGISRFYRIRCRPAFIEIVYYAGYVQNVDGSASVSIAADINYILTGITNSIAVGIGLIGIIDIRAVVPLIQSIAAAESGFLPAVTIPVDTNGGG